MGWISERKMRTGCSLYNEGPKKKGPLRKIVRLTSYGMSDLFGSNSGWLECGHWVGRCYGNDKAICEKCRDGKPKDEEGPDGWPTYLTDLEAAKRHIGE